MSRRQLTLFLVFGTGIVFIVFFVVSILVKVVQFGFNFFPVLIEQTINGNPTSICISIGLVIIALAAILRIARR